MSIELFASSEPLEFRAATADAPATIHGYAAVYNVLSADMGGWRERILPGAFTAALASGQDVLALVNHDPAQIIGRTSANTLTLQEDQRGLRFFVSLPDTTVARDLQASIAHGDIKGASFGFKKNTTKDRFTLDQGQAIRELLAIDLIDVSPTPIPAYPASSVSLRSDPTLLERAQAVIARPELASRQARFRTIRVTG